MRRSLLWMCLLGADCGKVTDANKDGIADGVKSPDSVTLVAPSTPIGSLSGQVLNTQFGPLESVKVSVVVGGTADSDGVEYSTSTDNKGNWAVKGLPGASSALVTLEKADFAIARLTAQVPGQAGNFPVNNGNGNVGVVLLTSLVDTFRVQVITADGQPADSVKAILEVSPSVVRYLDQLPGYGLGAGIFVTEATTDKDGNLAFVKVPSIAELSRLDGTFSVTVGAFDKEGADGRPEFLGTRQQFAARDVFLGTSARIITLPSARPSGPLKVIASNIDSMVNGAGDPLKSMVKPGKDDLFFVFDQLVLPNSLSVKVTDETGLSPVMSMSPPKGNIVQVSFAAPLENGREYNIALRATSAQNGSTFQQAAYFFGGDPATPKPFLIEKITWRRSVVNSGSSRLEPFDRVVITFNQPVRPMVGRAVEVLFDADLDGMGGRGNVLGEKSPAGSPNPNTAGFATQASEPLSEPGSTFTNLASGYTSRHEFLYQGPGYLPVSAGTSLTVLFSELPNSLLGYRTLWGNAVDADATAVLMAP